MNLARAIQNLPCRLACDKSEAGKEESRDDCQARCPRWQKISEALATLMSPAIPFDELADAIYGKRELTGRTSGAFLKCSRMDHHGDLPDYCDLGLDWNAVSSAIEVVRRELPLEIFKNYMVELHLAMGHDLAEAMFIRFYEPQTEEKVASPTTRLVLPPSEPQRTKLGLFLRLCEINRWIITVRWILAAMVSVCTAALQFVLRLDFPFLMLYGASAAALSLNAIYTFRLRGHRGRRLRVEERCNICTPGFLHLQIVLDFLCVGVIVFLTGGMISPITLFFLPHLVFSALLLSRLKGLLTTAGMIAGYGVVVFLQYLGLVPQNSLMYALSELTRSKLSYVAFFSMFAVFATIIHVFTLRVTAELNRWQEEFLAMHDLSAERSAIFNKLNERLLRMDTIRQRMVRVASHDLKSPVAAIEAALKVLLGGYAGELSDKQIAILQQSVNRLMGMREFINEILDVATMEKEGLRRELIPTDVVPLMRQVEEEVQWQAKEKGLNLSFSIPDGLPRALAAPSRFIQVLRNLVSNAVKFTPQGGDVSVTVQLREHDLYFNVQDTGPGIHPDDMEHLFQEFYRVRTMKGSSGGSGLGLFIVRSIISAHGGRVWVDSELGKGSTFHFTLRLAEPESRDETSGSSTSNGAPEPAGETGTSR